VSTLIWISGELSLERLPDGRWCSLNVMSKEAAEPEAPAECVRKGGKCLGKDEGWGTTFDRSGRLCAHTEEIAALKRLQTSEAAQSNSQTARLSYLLLPESKLIWISKDTESLDHRWRSSSSAIRFRRFR
jgi:hypothetical protein